MNIYNDVVMELKKSRYVNELYRFQGANSFDYFNIKKNKFYDDIENKYVYFSKSIDHHKYFTIRRLRQFLNQIVFIDDDITLCRKNLRDIGTYNMMKNIISNSDLIHDLSSISLIVANDYYKLLMDNCCSTHNKISSKAIVERVDRRVYGGGFGLSEEWLRLLNHMSLFTTSLRISRADILEMLQKMRAKQGVNMISSADFLLQHRSYLLSDNLYNSFIKYDIMNDLECILDKGLCLESSELNKKPTETIGEIISNFQSQKENTLKILEKSYNRKRT